MKIDIINGIEQRDFVKKYNVCNKTFNNYRNKILPDYTRIYKRKVDINEFVLIYNIFNDIGKCASYFNESKKYMYKIKYKAREKGLI